MKLFCNYVYLRSYYFISLALEESFDLTKMVFIIALSKPPVSTVRWLKKQIFLLLLIIIIFFQALDSVFTTSYNITNSDQNITGSSNPSHLVSLTTGRAYKETGVIMCYMEIYIPLTFTDYSIQSITIPRQTTLYDLLTSPITLIRFLYVHKA